MRSRLIWGWLLELIRWFQPTPERKPMVAYKDLLTAVTSDLATQAADATTLASATASKAHSDADVASSTVAFASAVKSAPGGFVVDATGTTVTLYTSADGQTYNSTVIASITDPVAGPTAS